METNQHESDSFSQPHLHRPPIHIIYNQTVHLSWFTQPAGSTRVILKGIRFMATAGLEDWHQPNDAWSCYKASHLNWFYIKQSHFSRRFSCKCKMFAEHRAPPLCCDPRVSDGQTENISRRIYRDVRQRVVPDVFTSHRWVEHPRSCWCTNTYCRRHSVCSGLSKVPKSKVKVKQMAS